MKCKCTCKVCKLIGKCLALFLAANAALFVVFFFDLDGKILFKVVEPFLKNHYDNMERKDVLKTPYDIEKYTKGEYDK